ncbi:MAG: SGNH/GDSL hydrolase family protein [Ruminococcaceae bacterium]|nr:SGNH/GDSL hydrolase family protein [Oscillospiraceae bacterium]
MSKLFIFGDSILKGVTYSENVGKYKLCKPDYSALEKQGYEVINLSKMGATISYCEKILKEEIKEYDEDNIVLIEYGGNDCDYRWSEISNSPETPHSAATPHTEFEDKYKGCVEYAKSMGAKVFVSNLVPLESDRYMDWISRGLNYDVILNWLGDKNMLYRWHESYSRIIEKLSQKLGAKLIDLRSVFLTTHSFGDLICKDGIHPTEDGHRLICDTVTNAVLSNA